MTDFRDFERFVGRYFNLARMQLGIIGQRFGGSELFLYYPGLLQTVDAYCGGNHGRRIIFKDGMAKDIKSVYLVCF